VASSPRSFTLNLANAQTRPACFAFRLWRDDKCTMSFVARLPFKVVPSAFLVASAFCVFFSAFSAVHTSLMASRREGQYSWPLHDPPPLPSSGMLQGLVPDCAANQRPTDDEQNNNLGRGSPPTLQLSSPASPSVSPSPSPSPVAPKPQQKD